MFSSLAQSLAVIQTLEPQFPPATLKSKKGGSLAGTQLVSALASGTASNARQQGFGGFSRASNASDSRIHSILVWR
jgi:hypothetical protein